MNEVRNTTSFRTPILAVRNGRLVNIIAVGDQEGKSPVYLSVDEQGQSTWSSIQDFRVIDAGVLPHNIETLRQTMQDYASTTKR